MRQFLSISDAHHTLSYIRLSNRGTVAKSVGCNVLISSVSCRTLPPKKPMRHPCMKHINWNNKNTWTKYESSVNIPYMTKQYIFYFQIVIFLRNLVYNIHHLIIFHGSSQHAHQFSWNRIYSRNLKSNFPNVNLNLTDSSLTAITTLSAMWLSLITCSWTCLMWKV